MSFTTPAKTGFDALESGRRSEMAGLGTQGEATHRRSMLRGPLGGDDFIDIISGDGSVVLGLDQRLDVVQKTTPRLIVERIDQRVGGEPADVRGGRVRHRDLEALTFGGTEGRMMVQLRVHR